MLWPTSRFEQESSPMLVLSGWSEPRSVAAPSLIFPRSFGSWLSSSSMSYSSRKPRTIFLHSDAFGCRERFNFWGVSVLNAFSPRHLFFGVSVIVPSLVSWVGTNPIKPPLAYA